MKLYRISIKLESSLVTSLKGDTIWGHYVWGIANHEGDAAVSKFLGECDTDNPPLIVSSAYPHNSICLPIPVPMPRQKGMSKQKYSQIKQMKKKKFAAASDYIMNVEEDSKLDKVFTDVSVMHNSINRISNTVVDGNLYAVTESWVKKDESIFDLYVLSTLAEERVIELTEWAFENGYGADASNGHGKISVIKDSLIEINQKKKGTKYMALGPFVSNKDSMKSLRADVFIRTGKVGGGYSGCVSPYKKTVILYNEGAVFESSEPVQFIGELIKDVHSDSKICQSGFAPVISIGD